MTSPTFHWADAVLQPSTVGFDARRKWPMISPTRQNVASHGRRNPIHVNVPSMMGRLRKRRVHVPRHLGQRQRLNARACDSVSNAPYHAWIAMLPGSADACPNDGRHRASDVSSGFMCEILRCGQSCERHGALEDMQATCGEPRAASHALDIWTHRYRPMSIAQIAAYMRR